MQFLFIVMALLSGSSTKLTYHTILIIYQFFFLPLTYTMTFLTNIRSNTASTSTTTGALVIKGGLGVGGDVNIGGNETTMGNDITLGDETVAGISNITNTTEATNSKSGALIVSGGVGIAKSLYTGGAVRISAAIGSNDVNSGSLVINGGGRYLRFYKYVW